MSNPTAPVKTPLGHQELRHRTQGLGQRYRTVLLLVDGRRPLAEVLSMAQQAGARTSHLEELVRLGMLELPAQEPPAHPEPTSAPQVDAAEPKSTLPAAEIAVPPAAAPAPANHAQNIPAAVARVEAGQDAPVPALPATLEAASGGAESGPEAPAADEVRLDDVRRLLIDTLRRDTLLSRVFAPARVRAACTREELIGLVWEIERERLHARRRRGQLLNLQRARELLGMGNTLVAEDSLPWAPSEP